MRESLRRRVGGRCHEGLEVGPVACAKRRHGLPVASGLLIGGAGGALALAEPGDLGRPAIDDASVGDQRRTSKRPTDIDPKDHQDRRPDPTTKTPIRRPRPRPTTKTTDDDRHDRPPTPTRQATDDRSPTNRPTTDPTDRPDDPTDRPDDRPDRPTEPTTDDPTQTTSNPTNLRLQWWRRRCGGGFEVPDGRPEPPPDMQIPPPRDGQWYLGEPSHRPSSARCQSRRGLPRAGRSRPRRGLPQGYRSQALQRYRSHPSPCPWSWPRRSGSGEP